MRVGYLVAEPMIRRNPETKEIEGIFADMVRQIARTLNVEVEWVETNLASFAAGLQSDLFDFSVGPSFVTIPRAAAVTFTDPVAFVGNSAVVRADGPLTSPKSLQDFNQKGLRVAVLQGQALEEYSRKNLPEAEVIVIAGGDLTAPLVAVSAGRADVGLMNSLTITQYTQQHPELRPVLMGAESVEILPLAWATRKGDVDLRDFLNAAIAYLGSTGRIYEYQKKQPAAAALRHPAAARGPLGGLFLGFFGRLAQPGRAARRPVGDRPADLLVGRLRHPGRGACCSSPGARGWRRCAGWRWR